MDALILDFDGVVIDSEPVHLDCFRRVLKPLGISLTTEAYYSEYLGFDDHDCFAAVGRANGREFSEKEIAEMTAAKTALLKEAFSKSLRPLPGAAELIRSAAKARVPVAVCSGALRGEIELAGRGIGIWDLLATVVAAEDVRHGKPDPEGYQLTLRRLAEAAGRDIQASRCVVLEDSPAGIAAAKAVGMIVVGVTNSYPAEALDSADGVVGSLEAVTLADLDSLLV